MSSPFFAVTLGVVVLALAPTCWLAPFRPPLPNAFNVSQSPADIVRQGSETHFVYREELEPEHVSLRYYRWTPVGQSEEEIAASSDASAIITAPAVAVTLDGWRRNDGGRTALRRQRSLLEVLFP